MEPDDYQTWLAGGPAPVSPVAAGEKLFTELNCVTCHRARHAGARARAGRPLRHARSSSQSGETVIGGRGLHPRVDPDPGGQGRGGLPADHADLPGPGERGAGSCSSSPTSSPCRPPQADAGAGSRSRRRGSQMNAAAGRRSTTIRSRTLPKRHYLNADYGVRSWLLTTDHKRIALLYLVSVTRRCSSSAEPTPSLIRLELLTPHGRPRHRPRPTTSSSPPTA